MCYHSLMKKRTLRPTNKNALKTALLIAATAGTIGYQAHLHFQNQYSEEEQIDNFKNELIQYEEKIATAEPTKVTSDDKGERIDISERMPKIAIIYHDDGNVSLMINREYLSIEAALEKYPALTAGIKKYIEVSHEEAIKTAESLER